MSAENKDICCPHCQKPIGINMVARAMKESQFSFTMKPKDGEYLSASTVGGCIQSVAELMEESGKALGVKSRTVVENISFSENGEIKVNFLIANVRGDDEQSSGDNHGR